MNDLHFDNGNYPPGHDEKGIKVKCSGPAYGYDSDKMFHQSFKGFPIDGNQADQWMNKLRKWGDVINERAIERMKKEGIIT